MLHKNLQAVDKGEDSSIIITISLIALFVNWYNNNDLPQLILFLSVSLETNGTWRQLGKFCK
jgi:hypothetical protein